MKFPSSDVGHWGASGLLSVPLREGWERMDSWPLLFPQGISSRQLSSSSEMPHLAQRTCPQTWEMEISARKCLLRKIPGVIFCFPLKLHLVVTHSSCELFVPEISCLCVFLFHSFDSKASSAVVKLESRAAPGYATRKVAQEPQFLRICLRQPTAVKLQIKYIWALVWNTLSQIYPVLCFTTSRWFTKSVHLPNKSAL